MAFPALYKEIPYQDSGALFPYFAQQTSTLFLDSALTERRLGAVSYLAVHPFSKLEILEGVIYENGLSQTVNPLDYLRNTYQKYALERLPDSNVPIFQGGIAGLFSYDLGWLFEKLPQDQHKNIDIADVSLGLYDLVIAFDHHQKRCWLISTGQSQENASPDLTFAQQRLAFLESEIEAALHYSVQALGTIPPLVWETDFTRSEYEQQVQQVIDYILAGDIFQANLSQQFRATLPDCFDPVAFYQNLRQVNAATFAGYYKMSSAVIASASPERFIKSSQNKVETRPIKGTRPRFKDPVADQASASDLLSAEKDRAENVMIVDLLRNDLSRNCAPHTVDVPELCALESYASVHHLVSAVTGQLKAGRNSLDLLCDAFPGGSITGAPKIRAMEIIAELEKWRRGAYCGSLGFISFAGDMDSSILIRTVTFQKNQAFFNVGGGIVADSDPENEYEETLVKAKGIFDAFDAMSLGKSKITMPVFDDQNRSMSIQEKKARS